MSQFFYSNGNLYIEGVKVEDIIKNIKTPVYVYSKLAIENQYQKLQESLSLLEHRIFYSVKANSNVAILKVLGSLGAGMDVVSIGEYDRALAAGISGKDIVFSGVGKTEYEIHKVINTGIRQFNIESEPE